MAYCHCKASVLYALFCADYATSTTPVSSPTMQRKRWVMLHYVFMPPHEKRFCAPLCPPARIICPKTLRSDQCAASANPCTPCAECSSCIALSWCQHVAGYQLSAKAIAIAVVALVFVCFWLSTFGWSFRQRTSKKPVTVFVRPTSARSRGLCKAFHGLSTERY